MYGVMRLQFEDPKMQEYFEALPSKVRAFLRNSKIEISSPGELMMIGEHFKKGIGNAAGRSKITMSSDPAVSKVLLAAGLLRE